MKIKLIILFLLFYSYAFIRYHVGGKVALDDYVFVINKAIAWFAITLIGISILAKKWFERHRWNRKQVGIAGLIFALIHLLISILIFNPSHFPFAYNADFQFTYKGIFIICVGAISLFLFLITFLASLEIIQKKYLRFGFLGFCIIIFHPLLIGINKWLLIEKWPVFLPPITLIAVISCIYFIYLRSKQK